MKLASRALIRELDRYAIDELGIDSEELMARAGGHVADAAAQLLPGGGGGRVAVFCGSGNNGGDGVAAAARLLSRGVQARVFIVTPREKMTSDTRSMEARLREAGGRVEDFGDGGEAGRYARSCEVIIDAMFGVGMRETLSGDAAAAAELINAAGARVVSADIPSGVNADTGEDGGAAVNADITVTFTLPKPGHYLSPGCLRCGEIRVRDIGVPRDIVAGAPSKVFAVFEDDITLPRRERDTHKGDYGRDAIFAGSVGYTGAPLLAARAATRMGAGLVHVGVPRTVYGIVAAGCEGEMAFPLPCGPDGGLADTAADIAARRAATCDAILAGPGLGVSENAKKLVFELITRSRSPLILDADGINALEGHTDILNRAACPVILTPHAGEFRRICPTSGAGGAIGAAVGFAEKYGCILALKGYRTITAMPDGGAYINTTGGPALAKGGSGDVLAGMILALAGQKFPLKDAVLAAVCLHGAAGDMCAAERGEYGVTVGDLIDALPRAAMRRICDGGGLIG
jgi:NAD(P)H-hydrate epimerase